MPITAKLVTSEILMCGLKYALKQIPIVGQPAAEVVESLRKRHEELGSAELLKAFDSQLTRVERSMRDTVEKEIRAVLGNLSRPDLSGEDLTRELHQIHEQGWSPNLFDGLVHNSSHWRELKRNPNHYGRVLGDHDPIDPEKGIHLLIDADKTGVLELSPFALASLLARQDIGAPQAEMRVTQDIWAFPASVPVAELPPRVVEPPRPPAKGGAQVVVPSRPAGSITNSVGMTLVRIEPGEFTMGSDQGEDDEKPPHKVRITRAFVLGAHPVTQGQYREVMGKNPSHFQGSDDFPVEQVSWFDTVQFCNTLSERENRKPYYGIKGENVIIIGGNGYRLPTEAEWEFACRAGTSTRFPFGDDEADLAEYAWYSENSGGQTHPVGQRKPNRWGLFDMLGNVWEWCQDYCDINYYQESPRIDPPGSSTTDWRVMRGAGWFNYPRVARSAIRTGMRPSSRLSHLGFRVARVPSE